MRYIDPDQQSEVESNQRFSLIYIKFKFVKFQDIIFLRYGVIDILFL